ncbi:MAG TPA: hypothetical protein VGC67_17805 [Cellulomonas sp.]
MRSAELMEPVGYSGWVLVAGLVAVLLAVGWVVAALLWTRGRRSGPPAARTALAGGTPGDPFAEARSAGLAELDRVRHEHQAGAMDDREADLAVGAALRDFAQARSGLPARSLTAAELRTLGWTGGTSELLGDLLAPTFSAGGATPESVAVALDRAGRVVSEW